MSNQFAIYTPFHQQDEEVFCGPACLLMVLSSLGTPENMLSEYDLFDDANSHSTTDPAGSWYSGPDGMLWTIEKRNPAPDKHRFLLFSEDTEESISRKIIYTIIHYKISPIALIYDMLHWCVVSGYNISDVPGGIGDVSYIILGFWIKNPFPPTPKDVHGNPPPPHWAFDQCGSHGIYGERDTYVGYFDWQQNYMTGVRDGFWKNKFLAICDPEPAPRKPGRKAILKNHLDGEKIIDKNAAGEFAMNGLKEHGLTKYEPLEKILSDVKPDDPFLVHRLDRANDFYYIVPIVSNSNDIQDIRALVTVDARFGHFLQASFASEKGPMIFKTLSREKIIQLLGKRLEFTCEDKVLIIHSEVLSIYPSLVWRPCKESLSPLVPFYMITYQNYRIYVRMDGEIFTHLTTDLRGI